jgi:ubiquinone/menaquinone biosynthesis C-methylase UbiE
MNPATHPAAPTGQAADDDSPDTDDRPGTGDGPATADRTMVPARARARRQARQQELWDRSAESYNVHVQQFDTHRQITTLLAAAVPAGPADRILDFGCGPGNSTRLLRQHFPSAVLLGLDSAPRMIALARQLTTSADRIAYGCGDAEFFRAGGPEPVQAVVCSNSLFHIEDKAAVLDALHAVLTPGGRLVFSLYETVFTPDRTPHWPYQHPAPGQDAVMTALMDQLRAAGHPLPGRREDREVLTESALASLAAAHGFALHCAGMLRLRRSAAERLSFLAIPAVAAEVFPQLPAAAVAAAAVHTRVHDSVPVAERTVYAFVAERRP